MSVTADEFRLACGRFATGVCVASVLDGDGQPHGLTVNSFSSVSLEPPLVLICLGHAVTVVDMFRASKTFGVSILNAEQQAISEKFARKGADRFDGVEWYRGESGVPLITGALAAIECAVRHRVTAGDHDVFVAEMLRSAIADGEPLIYFASRYRDLAQ